MIFAGGQAGGWTWTAAPFVVAWCARVCMSNNADNNIYGAVRILYIGCYLLFVRRVSQRCQKNVRYLLTIQRQILFLNLLNKHHLKYDDELSATF